MDQTIDVEAGGEISTISEAGSSEGVDEKDTVSAIQKELEKQFYCCCGVFHITVRDYCGNFSIF